MKRTRHHTKPSDKFVSYLRISTSEQGESGLGLEAQRETVARFIKHNGNRIIAEFKETESGKKDDRPELMKAIQFAKDHNATIVVAKLDRLSRSVHFISHLMKTKVKFVCIDLPMINNENELVVHLMAAFAEFESKRIGQRTREALAAKRRREPDWKPGNLTKEGNAKAYQSMKTNADQNVDSRKAWHFIRPRREAGETYQQIADELNKEGYRTRQDKKFYPQTVRYIYQRFSNNQHYPNGKSTK